MESGVQPQPIGLSPEDRDALQALTDKLVSLSLDRGWDALLELLTDDVVFLPPDEPAVVGKAEVADFLNAYPSPLIGVGKRSREEMFREHATN